MVMLIGRAFEPRFALHAIIPVFRRLGQEGQVLKVIFDTQYA